MSDAKKIGTRIRELRKQKGFNSAEELAEKAKIPTSTLYRIEAGEKEATVRELTRIAQALEIDPVDLLPPVDATPEEVQISFLETVNRKSNPLDALNAFLKSAVEEHPAVNEHYKFLRRISQMYPADIRIGRGNMNMRISFYGEELDTLLQFISLHMIYSERLKAPDDDDMPF